MDKYFPIQKVLGFRTCHAFNDHLVKRSTLLSNYRMNLSRGCESFTFRFRFSIIKGTFFDWRGPELVRTRYITSLNMVNMMRIVMRASANFSAFGTQYYTGLVYNACRSCLCDVHRIEVAKCMLEFTCLLDTRTTRKAHRFPSISVNVL